MLKKQTVWLLTMFSLVAVLSVYYVTSPKPMDNVAFEQKADDLKPTDEAMKNEAEVVEEQGTVISNVADDELFTALRLDIEEERSKLRQELNAIVASNDVSAEEKSKAIDKLQQLSTVAEKEAVLETLIKAKGYEDALVRVDGTQVHITVKAKEHSKKAANEIIQLVRTEMKSVEDVAVRFQQ